MWSSSVKHRTSKIFSRNSPRNPSTNSPCLRAHCRPVFVFEGAGLVWPCIHTPIPPITGVAGRWATLAILGNEKSARNFSDRSFLVDGCAACPCENACFLFPGFGGPDRSVWLDIRSDIRPKTSALGWFFVSEVQVQKVYCFAGLLFYLSFHWITRCNSIQAAMHSNAALEYRKFSTPSRQPVWETLEGEIH